MTRSTGTTAPPAAAGMARSALAPLHVILPMRTLSGGKARLGGALDAEEREELVLGMLRHTIAVLDRWGGAERVHLVSPDPQLIAAAVAASPADDAGDEGRDSPRTALHPHEQPGEGLNEAIRLGVATAVADGATSCLVIPGDLPLITTDALDGFALAADAAHTAASGGPLVVIAPSDARSGTNALLLMPPDVIAPAFGPDSFESHLRAAAAVDAAVQVVSDPAFGFDLDTPDDLEMLDPDRLTTLTRLGRFGPDGRPLD